MKTYCNTTDLISFGKGGFYYLPKNNTIYKKGKGQDYKKIIKAKKRPIIKVTNREFSHRKIMGWM